MENQIMPSTEDFMSYEEITSGVMSQFPGKVISIESIKFKDTDKQRAVYKLTTSEGQRCLKKVYYNKGTLLFIYSVVEWLNLNGIACPRFIPTRMGIKYAEYKGNLFILTEWIDGRKCSYDIEEDICNAAAYLGKIHKTSYGFKPISGSSYKNNEDLYFSSLNKHFMQLLDASNAAGEIKDSFSKLFLSSFEYNMGAAKNSIETLSKVDFSKPIGDRVSSYSICHHDYVNKNIIFTPENNIYIIDFDRASMDMPVHDIISFIKRIMKREKTCWDFKTFKNAMEAYEQSRIISRSEYILILSYLTFPHKYWKLSRDYYKNRAQCNKDAFISILKKITRQNGNHQEFCLELKDYICNRFSEKL